MKERHSQEIHTSYDKQNIAEKLKQRRKAEQLREMKSIFSEYMQWIEDTMTTEEYAYIKLGVVLQGEYN